MYGDCQVLSSMVGGSSDNNNSIFGSNFNHNFMPPNFNIFSPIIPKEENGGMGKSKELEVESGSGSEQQQMELEQEEELLLDPNNSKKKKKKKKKRYHRHTARQIQEMESLFKECPHPDDKQRLKLSHDLGLKPRQVKFWFQNRRTQMKAQQDRQDNVVLRAENEGLKNDNYRLQAALTNVVCPNCGGPAMLGEMGSYDDDDDDDQQLRIENARLKEEVERVCCLVTQYSDGRAMGATSSSSSLILLGPSSLDLDVMSSYPPRKYEHYHDHRTTAGFMIMPPPPPPAADEYELFAGGTILMMEEEKSLAMEVAMSSVEELVKMCHAGEPLWIPAAINNAKQQQQQQQVVLNLEEYARMFSNCNVNLKSSDHHFRRSEATRDTAVVIMNSITLVDAFLDANKWVKLFPSIVSTAKTLQVLHSEVGVNSGGRHATGGSLHLMLAELQVLSPLVPTREAHFLRYCQRINNNNNNNNNNNEEEESSWAIVDFPFDAAFQNIMYNSSSSSSPSFPCSNNYYRRRPSGCLIQDMPNGYSRVTWVEHAEVEDGPPIHQVFSHLVKSGIAFGAQRWLAVLQRQCERLASLMARNISDLGVIPSPQARRNLMNLAQRMIQSFCVSISTCNGQSWTALSDSADDTVRITTRKVDEVVGHPHGLILSAVSTTWLPYLHHQVFDFLRDQRQRAQLEVLSNGNSLHEIVHIANGSHPGNCISLFRNNVASNSSQSVELVLQESCSDDSGSMVVYTTVDVDAVQLVMNGDSSSSSCVPLLPLGFVVLPHYPKNNNNDIGCLLTIGLQVLASTIPTAKLNLSSVTAINHHLCNTVHQINSALAKLSAPVNSGPGNE